MSSQMSYSAILGRFKDGIVALKRIPGYNPSKPSLTITSLEAVSTDAEAKNADAVRTGALLKGLRNERRFISFRSKESDVNCIENLMKNIASYLKAELGAKHPSFNVVDSIIKKISPPNDPKEEVKEGEEPKKTNSSSEKSYNSLGGFASNVYTIITELGESYRPTNENITTIAFKGRIDRLAQLNASIVTAGTDYASAVKLRDDLYNSGDGIISLVSLVKDYLASFEGGRKNPDYIAFFNAVK